MFRGIDNPFFHHGAGIRKLITVTKTAAKIAIDLGRLILVTKLDRQSETAPQLGFPSRSIHRRARGTDKVECANDDLRFAQGLGNLERALSPLYRLL